MSALEPPPFLEALREELTRVAEADARAAAPPARGHRLRLSLPRLRVALPIAVALLALAALVGVTTSGLLTPTHSERGDVALRDNQHYGPELRRTLALLQREPLPASALPPGIGEKGAADGAIRLTPPSPAADVAAPLRQPAWVVPALQSDDRLALVMETTRGLAGSPGLTAADVRAGRARLLAGVPNSAEQALVGLVPDGVDRVTVRFADGGSTELSVTDNAYGATLPAETFAGVSWSGMDGP